MKIIFSHIIIYRIVFVLDIREIREINHKPVVKIKHINKKKHEDK